MKVEEVKEWNGLENGKLDMNVVKVKVEVKVEEVKEWNGLENGKLDMNVLKVKEVKEVKEWNGLENGNWTLDVEQVPTNSGQSKRNGTGQCRKENCNGNWLFVRAL